MSETTGSTFLLTVMMVFFVLIVTFIGIIVHISYRFRIKNRIIDIMEQNDYESNPGAVINQIDTFIGTTSYRVNNSGNVTCGGVYYSAGYCLEKISGSNGDVYRVTVYAQFDLTMFHFYDFTIPISGETRTIERFT